MRNVVRLLLIGVMSIALTACLPDSDLGAKSSRQVQTRTAQATGLARSLSVAATQAADAFIRDNAANFATMPTTPVNIAALAGVALGPAANVVAAGWCADPGAALNRSLIVWLTPADAQNRFYPTALGEGSTGSVMSKLAEISDPTSVGVANGGNIQMGDGTNMGLGACAASFTIPVGAPVMVFANLQAPDAMAQATTRTETRTRACPSGKTGTITERKVYNVDPHGAETVGQDWTIVADLCSSQVASVATPSTTRAQSNLLGNLENMVNNLADGELKDALKDISAEDCVRNAVAQGGDPSQIDYDTCSAASGDETEKIADLQVVALGDPHYEYMTGPLTTSTLGIEEDRAVTNIPDTSNANLIGHFTSSIWQPITPPNPPVQAKYKRSVQDYQVTYPDGSQKIVSLRGLWEGDQLEAQRDETITFSIDDYAPNWRRVGIDPDHPNGVNVANLTVLEEGGVKYTRKTRVYGWMPMPPAPNALTPNKPVSDPWSLATISGKWLEREGAPYLCHDSGIMGLIYRERTHTLIGYKQVESSDWTTTGVQCNAVCGVDSGQYISGAPPTGSNPLCKVGTPTAVTTVPGSGSTPATYSWTCKGTNGATDAACLATQATTQDGVCGGSANGYSEAAPSTGLCSKGTATAVTSSGSFYTWGCKGTGTPVGQTVSCQTARLTYHWSQGLWGECSKTCGGGSQSRSVVCMGSDNQVAADSKCTGSKPAETQICNATACPPNAKCGGSNGNNFATAPTVNLCDVGTAGGVTNDNGQFKWTCTDSGSSTTANCAATNTSGGACGCSSGQSFGAAPATYLCNSGTASWTDDTGTDGTFNWSCTAGGVSASCSATKSNAAQPGQCGTSDGTTVSSAPSSNLCGGGATATWTDQTASDGTYNWTCPGANGGAAASCSATKATTPATGVWTYIGGWSEVTSSCQPTQHTCDPGLTSQECAEVNTYGACPSGNGGPNGFVGTSCTLGAHCAVNSSGTGSQFDQCNTYHIGGGVFRCQ